jgi:hypothetical protein
MTKQRILLQRVSFEVSSLVRAAAAVSFEVSSLVRAAAAVSFEVSSLVRAAAAVSFEGFSCLAHVHICGRVASEDSAGGSGWRCNFLTIKDSIQLASTSCGDLAN